MKFTRMILPALAVGAVATLPAHAVPVVFDFTGTISQHGGYDYSSGTYQGWEEWDSAGTAFSAQFIVETDLFGPMATGENEYARSANFAALPGAITASFSIGGVPMALPRFNTEASFINAADSKGFVTFPSGGWSIVPDQWNVNFRSREVTPQGYTSLFDFSVGAAEDIDPVNMTGGTSMFSFEDITSPLSLVTLPIGSPYRFKDVQFSLENYTCNPTCRVLDGEYWYTTVTSVTRTVGTTAVPEPATLALLLAGMGGALLMRRRRMA